MTQGCSCKLFVVKKASIENICKIVYKMERKHKGLSIEDKIEIINAIESGKKKFEVYRQFALSN